MNKIPATALLKVLNNADGSVLAHVFPLIEEISRSQKEIGKKQLIIEINTDDDFFVNGEYSYRGVFPLGNSFACQVFNNAINSLTFTPLKGKEYRLETFLGYVRELSVLAELTKNNRVSVGGNQTLEAYVHVPATLIHFGSVAIDLQA